MSQLGESLEEHFRQQRERMEISDEDWEEYEERMRQQTLKRKREHEDKGQAPLSREKGRTSVEQEPVKRPRISLRRIGSPLSDPICSPPADPVVPTEEQVAGPSTKLRQPALAAPTNIISNASSTSSDITSPEMTPLNASGTTSAITNADSVDDFSDNNFPNARGPKSSRSSVLDRKAARKAAADEKQRIQSERLANKVAQQTKREAEKLKAEQEQKEARMTPLEYAAILEEKWRSRIAKTSSDKLFLTDKVIFLIFEEQNKAQKNTRIKLDIIAKHGGKVAEHYDPNTVTHIIPTSTSITLKRTLRTLGLKSLSEIPPNIKTVKWSWIVSGLTKRTPDSEVMHELFKQRMAYMYSARSAHENRRATTKGGESPRLTTSEHSVIEDFNSVYDSPNEDELIMPPHAENSENPKPAFTFPKVIKNEVEDPLLPFYAKAREEAEAEEPDEDSDHPQQKLQEGSKARKYKGFQCDKKGTHIEGASPNWDIIEKLAELRELHRESGTQDDKWRVISYQKAIGSLKSCTTRVKSREEAMKLAGVSDKTADKIMEIAKTGDLRRIKYTKTDDLNAMRLFSGIYGVGSNTARRWYNSGLKTLTDLHEAVQNGTHKLSMAQQIGLDFYDDINERMPRAEAREIFDKIRPIALSLDPRLSMEIMGSFRRGKETCGDIDILLTRPTDDGVTHAGILPKFCNILHKPGILTEDLATPEDWVSLEAIYRGLCRRDADSKRRRIDILCVPYECRGAARIYYTGDDIFNRSIRLKANKMNMSLNQRGLFQDVIRDPKDRTKKLCPGSLLCSHSEKKIFEILGVPWQEPHERVRSG